MERKIITIKDIAEKTGVSKSTVSRVLCNDVHVSPETREKVLSCARDMNFKPNYFAKGLKTRKSRTIAFLVPNIEIMIYPAIIHAMEEETLKHGYTILLCDIQENKDIALEYIRNLKNRNVDGFIFSTAYYDKALNDEITEAVAEGFPSVNLLRTDDSDVVSVALNNAKGSELGVDYLINKGRKRIAFLQGQEYLQLYRDRFQGYRNALEKHNIEYDESLVWQGFQNGEFSAEKEVEMRLKSGPGVDAIFCASDNLAVSTLHTLRQMRYSIPEDIAVIGYDNVPISELLYPRLTSIGQPFKEMGRKAINVLIDMIEDRDIGEDRNFIFDPYLLIRDTVG